MQMPMIAGRRIRLGLTLKLVLVADMALNIFILYVIAFALPTMQRNVLHEIEKGTEQQAEAAWSILQYNYQFETSGLATRNEAQARALDEIASLASGSDQEGDLWVYDYQPVLLASTYMPDRVNTNVGDVRDASGKAVFSDMVNISRSEGEGLYKYTWQPSDGSSAEATLSYVKSFEPWGWAVSTANSIEAVNGISASQTANLGWMAGGVGVLALILFWLAARAWVMNPLSSLKRRPRPWPWAMWTRRSK